MKSYMFGIGVAELLIILVIVLLSFGASKLPAMGAGFGKGIRNFKHAVSASGETDADPDSHPLA